MHITEHSWVDKTEQSKSKMDIYYMGETLPFQPSMRGPVGRDFEKFPIGSLERSSQIKSAYCVAQAKTKKEHSKKDSCPFCKEQKKKPLATYMRKRQSSKRTESICEEAEEEEIEEAVEAKENDPMKEQKK